MNSRNEKTEEFISALEREAPRYSLELSTRTIREMGVYFETLSEWNPNLHLVGPCSPSEFASRHVLESLTAIPFISVGANVVDIGSGGGLPIIPCLIARPDISAKLVEASTKKAVFLSALVDSLGIKARATVIPKRFQEIEQMAASCLTCRALERFPILIDRLIKWAAPIRRLLLFGSNSRTRDPAAASLGDRIAQSGLEYKSILMPSSENRFLFVVEQKPRKAREQST